MAPSSGSKRLRAKVELIQKDPEAAARKLTAVEDLNDALNEQIKELMMQRSEERKEHEEAKRRLAEYEASAAGKKGALLQLKLEEAGLSRATITSSEWHKANPDAANHLFGSRPGTRP